MKTKRPIRRGGAVIILALAVIYMAFRVSFSTASAADRTESGAVQLQVYDVIADQSYDLGIVSADTGYFGFWRMRVRKLKIPTLAEVVPKEASCGKLLDVEGNWCYPVCNGGEGKEVLFFTETPQARITYWVNHYDPDGNIDGEDGGKEDTAEAEAGNGPGRKWKQTVVLHSNDPTGPEDVLTVTYNVNSYISSSTSVYNGYVHSYDQCGFRLPPGYRLKENYWNDKPDGTGKVYWRNSFYFQYKDAGSTCHLYAQYEELSQEEGSCYEIAYHRADNSLIGVKRILKGQPTLIGIIEKGSARLRGWSTDQNSDNVEYQPGERIVPEEDLRLYAVWNEESISGPYTVEWYDYSGNRIKSPEERTGMIGENVSVAEKDRKVEGYVWRPEHPQTVETAILEPEGRTVLRLYFDMEYVNREITVEKVFQGMKAEEIPDDFRINYQVTNEEVPDFCTLSGVLRKESAVRKWYTDGENGESFPSLEWTFTVQIPKSIEAGDGYLRESSVVYREENEYIPGYRLTASSFDNDRGRYVAVLNEGNSLSSDIVLYNQYEREVTVTWLDGHREGEEGKIKQIFITAGEDYSGQYPGDPERSDYVFHGWGIPVTDEWGNITIIAQWKPIEPEEPEPEESEPEESEPEESEPEESEPEEPEPEPEESEPEPEESEPEESESEPEESEPEEPEPEESEPEPEESEPEESEPEEPEPEEPEPEESEPEEPEPEESEPEPEESEPEESEPEEPEPEESEPEPEESEPEEAEPEPEESEPEPEGSEPEESEPEPEEPELEKPEAEEAQPEESEPEIMAYSEESLALQEPPAESAPVTGENISACTWTHILSFFSIFFLIGAVFCGVRSICKSKRL